MKENQSEAQPVTEEPKKDSTEAQPDPREERFSKMTEELEVLKKQYETVVNTNNTTQKAMTELKKQLKEKEIEAMSAEDKAKALSEAEAETKKRIEELEAREKALTRQRTIDSFLTSPDVDLPTEFFSGRIIGESEEEIKADVNKVKKFIDDLVEKKAKARVNKLLAGDAPKSGDVVPQGSSEKIEEHMKTGGKDAMANIIHETGVFRKET
jgi:chromosome segregation ATPase